MMIHPTAQLRGNGTVGSGVLLYSEEQHASPGKEERVYTTFVLTAHHVVLEVTGDQKDASQVKEVNLLVDSETDEVETFEARLVLEDRYRDLALLRLDTTRQLATLVEFMPLRELDDLDVFSPAYAVGCPLGNRPMPTLGEISSEDSLATMAEYVNDRRLHMGYSFELLTDDASAAYIRGTVENLEAKMRDGWPCWPDHRPIVAGRTGPGRQDPAPRPLPPDALSARGRRRRWLHAAGCRAE